MLAAGSRRPDKTRRRKRERVPHRRAAEGGGFLPLAPAAPPLRQSGPFVRGAVDRSLLFWCFFFCVAFFPLQSSSPCAFHHHFRPRTITFVQRQLSGTWCYLRRVSPGMSAIYYFHISLLRAPVCVASTATAAKCRPRISGGPHRGLCWNSPPSIHYSYQTRSCHIYFRSDLMQSLTSRVLF
jgi:hypothetical protein